MKYLSYLKYAFLVISALVVILYFVGVASDVDGMLYWAYILLGLTIAAAIILPAVNLAKNPKGALRSLIGLAVIVIVAGVAYALSDSAPIITAANTYDNPTELKLSDMGLYVTYTALGVAVLSIVVSEIYNVFK